MMSSLERFKLPAEDTRLLRHDDTIFKIKLCYDSQSPWLPCPQRILHEEVEKVIFIQLFTDTPTGTDSAFFFFFFFWW